MTPKETAEAFTALLKSGGHEGAAKAFNAEDIVSLEAMEGPMAMCKGRAAVQAKSDWWYANHEIHKVTTEGPFVNGNQFLVEFDMDFTIKATGQRLRSKEWGLYTIRDGKISEERFFYPLMA
ncbi:MAG: nuclear transport factor 2 family protein [Methylobacterium sp.]|nr:nuclear transport factor 2 family protein [Methylobacterium sp.]MCA3653137.1 nuclear transport factor 2 family protein [Methylobacterium sp.]MCA4922518.1 nuclear transport factor 2 family protein [Methylobacterium sp.]